MVLSSYAPTLCYFREDMMLAMLNNGHEVIAAAPEPQEVWEPKFRKMGIKYISINGIERTGVNPLKDILGFISILKAIKKEKPDKIFTYQAKTIIYGALAAKFVGINEIYVLMGGLGSVFRTKRKSLIKKILKIEYKIAFKFSNKIFIQNKDDYKKLIDSKLIKHNQAVMINGSGVKPFLLKAGP